MGFADDLRKFARTVDNRQNAFVREVIGQVSLSLLLKSPVGDPSLWQSRAPATYEPGRFRANWMLGIDGVDSSTTDDRDIDGGETLDRIVGNIPDNAAGHVYYLTNSLPYALRIENGWSSQAPAGVVTLTVIEYADIAARARLNVLSVGGGGFGQ